MAKDLFDLQAVKDGSYRYIMHYVENRTKFHVLRLVKSKTSGVAHEHLLIFLYEKL